MVDLTIVKDPRSDAEIKLDRLRRYSSTIDRRLRLMFAQRIVGHIQKNWLAGQALKRRSGDLAASMCHIDETQHATFIGSYGVKYARAHELGVPRGSVIIKPKYKKMLAWKGPDGAWHRARSVRMYLPARPFIRPGIEHYMEYSDMAERDADKFLLKELDKVSG